MDLLREKLRARGAHRACFGGDSSSASTQNTTYNYADNRAVTNVSSDDHSTNLLSGNNSSAISLDRAFNTNSFNTTTITATDHGAVAAGAATASAALQSNATNTELLYKLADKLFQGTSKSVEASQTLTKELSATAQQAYQDATEQANGNKTMLLMGLIVVGIVAWKK